MRMRRIITCSMSAIAIGSLLTAPSAFAGVRDSTHPGVASPTIGRIAYLTKADAVKLAEVHANGGTSSVETIGPITPVAAKQTIQVLDLMASGDGTQIAWQEQVLKHIKGGMLTVKTVLVEYDVVDGLDVHLTTEQAPVGFAAADQLVTSNGDSTKRLVRKPTPHLIAVKGSQFPLAAYSAGVIDTADLQAPPGPRQTEQLRLTTFAGAHTVLHNYVLAPTDYRFLDAAWVSGDGKHFVVERGNHQDFGGLGPSSLADEYALSGGHARSQLGHFGTLAAQWRVASVSYAGSSDAVWAVWERGTPAGATSVVAVHEGGKWVAVTDHGIAVAGNSSGYVISQPGKFVSIGSDAPAFNLVPTRHALLRHGGTSRALNAEGSAFVWVSAAAVTLSSVRAAKVVPPDSGAWRVSGTDLKGALTVTAKHAFETGFHGKIGPDAETACGTGSVSVLGKHKIIHISGEGEFGPYNLWGVGRNAPNSDPVIQPIKVTVNHNGHHGAGRLVMSFLNARGHSKAGNAAGELFYKNGTCDLQFDINKA
jgi:hypothetical protein